MSLTVRRVVTGHSEDGKAIIVSEGPVPVVRHAPLRPGYSMNEVWVTQAMPAVIDQEGEPTDRPRSVEPPRNGTVCRIIEFPPEASWIGNIDAAKAKEAFASLGSGHARRRLFSLGSGTVAARWRSRALVKSSAAK